MSDLPWLPTSSAPFQEHKASGSGMTAILAEIPPIPFHSTLDPLLSIPSSNCHVPIASLASAAVGCAVGVHVSQFYAREMTDLVAKKRNKQKLRLEPSLSCLSGVVPSVFENSRPRQTDRLETMKCTRHEAEGQCMFTLKPVTCVSFEKFLLCCLLFSSSKEFMFFFFSVKAIPLRPECFRWGFPNWINWIRCAISLVHWISPHNGCGLLLKVDHDAVGRNKYLNKLFQQSNRSHQSSFSVLSVVMFSKTQGSQLFLFPYLSQDHSWMLGCFSQCSSVICARGAFYWNVHATLWLSIQRPQTLLLWMALFWNRWLWNRVVN